MNITERIARFVVETKFEEIPAEAVEVAKGAMRDCLGVTLAAAREPASVAALDLVREIGGNAVCSVVGAGFKTSPPLAALANGTIAHALDYDDVTYTMLGHPSVPVLPAVLALGEYAGATGRDAIAAYLLGYEVETKLGRAIGRGFYTQGWHPTAVLGTIGAAAASARLLGLSVAQCAMALGIAASQASGLRQNFGTDTKPLHAGLAARNGVLAAMLAKNGLTADEDAIGGSQGFLSTFGGRDQARTGPLAEGLGNPWDILSERPSIKAYPCCAYAHRSLDAILHIVSTSHIDPDAVASITCAISETARRSLVRSNPATGLEGKFSLEYVVSAAIVDGHIGLQTFTDEQVARPRVRSLMEKVRWDHHDGRLADGDPVTVTVTLHDGQTLFHSILQPKGSPDVPLSAAELEAKYVDCARVALTEEDVRRSSEILAKLEDLPDIRQLSGLLG